MTATLLPNGEQTFVDANGVPLAGGSVYFYIPSTTTPKNTWQDPTQLILNANPVVLDSAGRAIIYGSGSYRQIVKDSLGNTVWDQLTADTSTTAATSPTGQCYFRYTSTSVCTLLPWNGNQIVINSVAQTVPDAGVTLSNSGLSNTTIYYVYAYMNSSTMTLETSTTGYAVQAGTGVYIKSGDATRSLVGLVYLVGGNFVNTSQDRLVRSWFNEYTIPLSKEFSSGYTTTSATFGELSSSERLTWIAWHEDHAFITGSVQLKNSSAAGAGNTTATGIGINSTSTETRKVAVSSPGADYFCCGTLAASGAVSSGETYNYATLLGKTAAGTATWSQNATSIEAIVYRRY